MKNTFHIHIIFSEPEVFVKSERIVFEAIYIQVNDQFFPAENWLDNSVVIMNWWIGNLIQLDHKKKVTNLFMEGPFGFICEKQADLVVLNFYKELIDKKKSILKVTLNYADYKKELLLKAKKMVALCKEKEIVNTEVDLLKVQLQTIKTKEAATPFKK